MSEIIRRNSPRDAVVNDIIDREWAMFQKTQNMGGRASCQDQFDTFYINRYSQHSILSADTLESYRNDLIAAEMAGRNLVTEKYAYMMEFTDPEYYAANLRDRLPRMSEEKAGLIAEIVSRQLVGYQAYAAQYPAMAGAGRPADEGRGYASIRDYSIGEYKTYSVTTLGQLLHDLKKMENPVMEIQKVMVGFYGFDSLEAAETTQRKA